jgi:hypothetical protein|tara:strand:- start:1067 stop:1243 length:177 start_codon:yes stop_codon:yes gene_type:complete
MANKKETKYIVDISSIYEVDKESADILQGQADSLNQEWLTRQVENGNIVIVNIIEQEA